jgi:hypothetical protein
LCGLAGEQIEHESNSLGLRQSYTAECLNRRASDCVAALPGCFFAMIAIIASAVNRNENQRGRIEDFRQALIDRTLASGDERAALLHHP